MSKIEHLLRQEKTGGYWLIRDEGRAIELDESSYQLMAKLKDANDERFAELLRELQPKEKLYQSLTRAGLTAQERWSNLRHVPLRVPLCTIPQDAVSSPKRIYFEITRRCNLSCRSCFNNSHHKMPDELSTEEILSINQQAFDLGVFEIRYTGGECTTHPDFQAIVTDAVKKGFYISIGTNGVYTDEQLEWLPHCGIDWFIISLDGDRTTNDKVRGEGTFDSVLKTLRALSRAPSRRVRLNMVVAKHNLSSIEAVAQVAATHGATSLNLIPLRPYGRSVKHMSKDMFTQGEFYGFIREINRLRKLYPSVNFSTTIDLLDPEATTSRDLIVQKKSTCAAGVEACVVGPQGHIYGCSYSPASFPDSPDEEGKKTFIAGNIREHSLQHIWRDSKRWAVFRDLSQYKNPTCHSCGHYQVRCSGSCQIMAWYQIKHKQEVASGTAEIKDFMDPYCFKDLLEEQGKTADMGAPCGGEGM